LRSEGALGLESSKEYYNVDVIGYTENPKEKHNWKLHVAFEHENTDGWDTELCKLCYIAADLRVIASYYDFANKKVPVKELLKKRIDKLGIGKVHRVPNSEWLFIFGPRARCAQYAFIAYTLDSELNVVPIQNTIEVKPISWAAGK